MKVLALPQQGWKNDAERDQFKNAVRNANPSGYVVIFDFTGIGDLVARIRAAMQSDPDHPCLILLEIWAHSNPVVADGMAYTAVAAWATELMTLVWCDNADIYLAGCNTGLTLSVPAGTASGSAGPIAKALADAMPFDNATFPHHIVVHGSAGYLSGCNAVGPPSTECTIASTWQRVSRFAKFVWGFISGGPLGGVLAAGTVGVDWPPYPGCRGTSGAGVWNDFKNWT